MNDVLQAILKRRSVRTFKPDQISESELQKIIESGQFAPSARNEQPCHFTVVQNKELQEKINQVIQKVFLNSGDSVLTERAKADHFSPFYHAPTLIIVSADSKVVAPEADSSLALGNMFLAAHSMGIGSVWIHSLRSLFNSEEGKALNKDLKIPDGYVIYGSGAFGYNSGNVPAAAPRKAGTVTFIK